MRKLVIVAASLAALAIPTAAMASAPAHPGGFGTERASNIHNQGGQSWGQEGASVRAGTNGTTNQAWMDTYGYLPVESSLTTP
jgi:hypothetical protein